MSALLPSAADVILASGFVPDRYHQDILDGVRWRPVRQCPVCPRGAIAVAGGKDPDWMAMLDRRGLAASDYDPDAYAKIRDAERRFARYLVVELGAEPADTDGEVIEGWADSPERTQPQVVGALRAADEYDGRPA